MFRKRKLTLTQYIVYSAIFGAIASVLLMIQVPYPLAPFLKFDLSDVITLLVTAINPILGITVTIVKIIITELVGQFTDQIGILSVFISSMVYVLMFTLLRNIKINIIIKLIITIVVITIVQLTLNYFVVLPFYFNSTVSALTSSGVDGQSYLNYLIALYGPFNILKSSIVCIAYYLVNKVTERV